MLFGQGGRFVALNLRDNTDRAFNPFAQCAKGSPQPVDG
jgi:hypothetical protein